MYDDEEVISNESLRVHRLSRLRFIKKAGLFAGLAVTGGLLVACGDATATPAGAVTTSGTGAATTAAGATGAVAGAGTPTSGATTTAGSLDWMKYKGTNLNILLTKNQWSDNLEKLIPDFEKLTGMKVQFENIPEQQARQKLVVDFTGGGTYDAFFTSLHVEKQRFSKAGWYTTLNDYLKNPALTEADYDWDNDIFPSGKDAVTAPDGKILALPISVDIWMFFYRKDILQEKGLKAPTTLEEMENIAKTLTTPPSMYGFVARGLKNANTPAWGWVLKSMGGDYLTKEGKASINTPQAVQSLEYYARLMGKYAPPGAVNFNWPEASAAFIQGQVAMYFDGVSFSAQFEDPTKSKIVGKVGYSVLPKGPAGQNVPAFTIGMAVSSSSKHKEAAYLFCQWATNKDTSLKEQLGGYPTSRFSALNNPKAKASVKMPPDWSEALLQSYKVATSGLPAITGVTEFRDISGVAIADAISGKSAKEVLDKANKEFQDLLDKTEK